MYRTSGEGGQLNAVSPRASMLRVGLGALICVAALAACATVPEVSPPRPEDHLLPNHAAYFCLNVSENLHLVSYLARTMGLDADVVLNRVNIVAGSLALDESAEPAFFGVALGRFPAGATRFALWKDRGFRRAVTHIPSADDQDGDETRLIFFRQADGPIEIAVPESGVILVSNRSVADLVTATGPPHPARDDGAAANLSDPGRIDPAIVERIGLVSTIGPGAGLREADTGTDLVIVLADPVAILSNSLGLELPRFPILQIALMATA